MHTQVPSEITDQILEFAHKMVSPTAQPQFVDVTPEPDCEPLECFANVQSKVENEGGRIQFGWSVWQWGDVYLEAEHHAVYVAPDSSEFIDITPCDSGTTERLFIPDDSATFDFQSRGARRDNLRFALIDDPIVHDYFKAAAKLIAFQNELPGFGDVEVHPAEQDKLLKLERRMERAQAALVETFVFDQLKNAGPPPQ
jgi:hypothetical protein